MRSLIAAITCLWLLMAASAQTVPTGDALDQQTERITTAAAELTTASPDLLALRENLLESRREAQRLEEQLSERIEEIRDDLDRLGDVIEGEAPSVTERRNALQADLEAQSALLGQARLNAAEADRLLGEIAALRRTNFYSGVFQRTASPILPDPIANASTQIGTSGSGLQGGIDRWVTEQREADTLIRSIVSLAAAFVFAILMAIPVRAWINRRVTRRIEQFEPLQSRRIIVAASKTIARAVPALIAGFAVYQAVLLVGLLSEESEPLLRSVWLAFVGVILVDGAATALLAPKSPAWRLISVPDRGAPWIRGLANAIAITIFADFLIRTLIQANNPNLSADFTIRGVTAIVLGALFIAVTRPWAWREGPSIEDGAQRHGEGRVRRLLGPVGLVLGAGIILAACLGYSAAAHFFALRIAFIIAIIAVGFALRALLRESVRRLDKRFRSSQSAEQDGDRLVFFWIGVLIDAVVLCAVVPTIFILFGSDWSDVRAVAQEALFGFQIGSVRISILQILTAIALFAVLLGATRFVQRTAETKVFPRTRMDIGVQNSLKTLIGYIGLVVAFMTGVGMLGFDLSNLAIIAGALSVGIGFGLQSIVNNFVSGLILLFERPIKVGDWIVTSSGEGIVKRISVRSTEIETFDRSSIIVPNSELISGSVTNWTHKNKLGRVTVAVGVSYDEDPDRILEILHGIPKQVDIVLNYPEPLILFTGFGDSSLDFEIRAFISDVGTSLKARTALRIAIFKSFREAGVEIPFPQRDLHLRSGVEGILPPSTPSKDPETET